MKLILFFILATMSGLLYAPEPSSQYKKYNVTGKVVNVSQIQKISGIILPTRLAGESDVYLCTESMWSCIYQTNAPGGLDGVSGVVRVTAPPFTEYCLMVGENYSWGYTQLTNTSNSTSYEIQVGDVNNGYGWIEPPETYADHKIGAYFYVPSSTPLTSGTYTGTVTVTIQFGYSNGCGPT